MHQRSKHEWQQIRFQINQHLKTLFNIEDTSGIELYTTFQRVSHLVELVEAQSIDDPDLSGPRWRIILSLFIAERMGKTNGMTPTSISYAHHVSKNTISSLLRGLEDQGLIQRTLDPDDLRIFRIQLTPSGRELAIKSGPQRLGDVNRLVSALSADECIQLTGLLDKLGQSLFLQLNNFDKDRDRTKAGSNLPSYAEEETKS
jgi:DNA-binding MarR family transcriptional regulator